LIAFKALYSARPIFLASLSGMFSRLATYAFLAAVSFYVLEVTGRADILALTLLSGTLPIVLIGFVSGQIVDRFNRAAVILVSILVRLGVALILIAGLRHSNAESFVVLISIACAIISVTDSITAIAFNSLIPLYVENDKLDKVNVAATSLMEFSRISGPFIGTLVFQLSGFEAVLIFCVGIYAIAAFPVSLVIKKTSDLLSDGMNAARGSVLSTFAGVVTDTRLLSLLLNGLLTHLSLFPFLMIGVPFFIVKIFNGQPAEFGIIEFAAAVGTFSSGFLIARFGNRSLGIKLLYSLVLLAIVFTLYAVLFQNSVIRMMSSSAAIRVIVLGSGSLLIFACYGLYASFFGAVIQSSVAPVQLGRVFSLVIITNALGRFFGFLIFGILFERNWQLAVAAFIAISWLKVVVHFQFLVSTRLTKT
jgi:MFS family permease